MKFFVDFKHCVDYTYRKEVLNVNSRIRKIRKQLDITQEEFGARIGVKGNTVAQWESGRNNPSDSAIAFLCREFHISEEWLRNGIGDMFDPEPEDELKALTEKYNLSATDRIMIEKYMSLSATARAAVTDFILSIAVTLNEDINQIDQIPRMPEDLERMYPPVEKPDRHTHKIG